MSDERQLKTMTVEDWEKRVEVLKRDLHIAEREMHFAKIRLITGRGK